MSMIGSSTWGRSQRNTPFTRSSFARIQQRLLNSLPGGAQGYDITTSASARERASAYSFGPQGPTRRQRQEMQRRQEQARKQDRVKIMVQALLMGLAGFLLLLWTQWMR